MELKIYNRSGVLKATVSPSSSSSFNQELMVEDAVSLSFILPQCVILDVNDYVEFFGVKYKIKKEYKPQKKSGQEYTYNVKFYGPIHDSQQVMYLNLTDGQYNPQFSLDGSPRDHLQKWVDNMNRVAGEDVWSIGDVIVAPNQTIEYNNLYCWDAGNTIAETFETEIWADGSVINLCRCERGDRVELGYMKGLTSLTQSENSSDVKFFTRLIPLGSTKNIDYSTYGFKRLQLPDRAKYIDRNTQYGLFEYVEETAFAEIYPHYTGTVTDVRSEEKKGEDGKSFTVYYFSDSGMLFDPNKSEIGGQIKHISFQSGNLNGRDFEANYNSTTKEWEIINEYPDEGLQIPGGHLIPKIGDKYIPWNFRMPAEYEKQAELDYQAAVKDFLGKYSDDTSIYNGSTDYVYVSEHNLPLQLGQQVRLMSSEYFGETGYRDCRMTKVSRKLENLNNATISCTNQVGKGWKQGVDTSINQLQYVVAEQQKQTVLELLKTWDTKEPTNYNAFSALRALREITNRSLSRLGDDKAAGHITFEKGMSVNDLIEANAGIVIHSSQANNRLVDMLHEEGDSEIMSLNLLEEGDDNSETLDTSLLEVASSASGGTLGTLDNTDEQFDTCADGTYILQKRGGIYYPAKGSAGGGTKMTLSFVSSSTPIFVYGRDGIIKYGFSSTLDGESTGSGSVTYTVNNKLVTSDNIEQGEVTFNAGKYLSLGDNILVVQVTDSYGTTRKLTFKISAVNIAISSTFDDTKVYTGAISFAYTPIGAVEKTVHFVVDGKEVGTYVTPVSNRQQTYSIPAQTHGAHSLEVYVTAVIDEVTVESEHLYFDIICLVSGNNTPVIASSFRETEIDQFGTLVIPYIVYSPAATTSSITLSANGSAVSEQTVDRTRQTWSYRADTSGKLELKIACGSVSKTFSLTVSESDIDVQPELADLALFLTSVNRSNNEEGRNVWNYGEIFALLTAFNWATNGWIKTVEGFVALRVSGDARVTIPYNSFANDFRATGKTIEFEFETRDVTDYDAVVLSCMNGGIGLEVTAQKAIFKSQQTTVETQFKEDERVRVSFVVEKKAENRLIFVYVNGEICGVMQYPEQDNFTQSNPVGISIGSSNCTSDIFNIRVYDNNLNRYQLLDNYMADMDNLDLKRKLFSRNNIYDDYGNVSYEKLAQQNISFTIIGELPTFKGDKKKVTLVCEDRDHPERSWSATGVEIDVQGTSSQWYPRKNYKTKCKQGFVMTATGEHVDKVAIFEGDIPVNVFCFKADFAESSGVHNTGMARLIDYILRGMGFLTEAQKKDPRVRTTVNGRPSVMWHQSAEESEKTFLGKYNYNNDKSTNETFGFKVGCESWEILNNTSDRVLFKRSDYITVDADGNIEWLKDFESRYPDGNEDYTNLKRLTDWLESVKNNPEKFRAEAEQYFDMDFMLSYYTITEFFAMVDQRAKNMFLTTFDGIHWICIFYDNDTCCGLNNEAVLAFDYTVEYHDKIGNKDVWNGAESTLWNNIEQAYPKEIAAMYAEMRSKKLLTYDECIRFLDTEQGDAWAEAVYNEDSWFKYIKPLLDEGNGSYLYAAQGSRKMHRRWWLYNRFKYMDSKYIAGDYKNDFATMRLYTPAEWTGVKPNADLTITSYSGQYVNVQYGSYTVGTRSQKNIPVKITAPDIRFNDTETIIFGAGQISSLGDLSALYPGTVDVAKMTKLVELVIGSGVAGYQNTNLEVLSVGANDLLRKLDVRNCPNLKQAIDLSQCNGIREVWAEGTGTTAVVLPAGGNVTLLHLPDTITNLTIRNQSQLQETGLSIAGVDNLSTIRWENTNGVNIFSIIDRCLALNTVKLERIRLINVSGNADTLESLMKLSVLKGLDENGNNTSYPIVTGKYHVGIVTERDLEAAQAMFPELIITYNQLKPESVTTFTFSSTQKKEITNVSFECNLNYVKVNDTTYKVSAQDGDTISFTFSCDNHVSRTVNYIVSGTVTKNYVLNYIPLRTIRVKVYSKEVYVSHAVITFNDKELTTDNDGYAYYRGGEAISGKVSASGYTENTFSFAQILNDTTNVAEVYADVDVTFIIKQGTNLLEGATVVCNNKRGMTDSSGTCILKLGKGTYDYVVTHPTCYDVVGKVSVGLSNSSVNVTMEFSPESMMPAENGNIQMMVTTLTPTINITSPTSSYSIDWGDGTKESAKGTGEQTYRHTYQDNINRQIEITDCEDITMCNATSDCMVAYWSVGNSKIKGLSFQYYKNLVYVGNVFKNDGDRTDFTRCFAYCSNMAKINADLFNPCVGAVKFYYTFYDCTQLKSIPADLFLTCYEVQSFGVCFGNCTKIKSIPEGLFDNCPNVISFSSTFSGCTNLESIPTGLFENCPNVTTFYSCFYGTSISTVPIGLFDNCPNVTDLSSCFMNSKISSIPAGLFDNCLNVNSFSVCFYGTYLKTIPVGLFDNCPNVKSFYSCFNRTNIRSIPIGLFDNCPNVTNFNSCFYSCNNLEDIPFGLFDNCPNVTDFSDCFYKCKNLTVLPELWKLYYGKNINKSRCFYDCTKASNWLEVPVSWGGTAEEYMPVVAVSGVALADYRAINARLSNIEEKLNLI